MPSVKAIVKRAYGRMLVRRHGVWFIDIPRTSSSSIRAELGRSLGFPYGKSNVLETAYRSRQFYRDHLPAYWMKEQLGARLWNRLFTFAIVRNPWDRTVSMYHYRRRVREIPDDLGFRDYVLALHDAGFERSVKLFAHPQYFAGCSHFVQGADGECLVDQIVRYEDRERGLAEIARRIGIGQLGQLRIQSASAPGRHYSTYYDDTTRQLIATKYEDDLEQFGYEFEMRP